MKDLNDKAKSGALLYRYDNYKQVNKNTATRFKTALKTPSGIYLAAVCAFITFWFFYSLIAGLCGNEPGMFIILFLPSVFTYFVGMLIIVVSVGGLWGKFISFALRKNLVKREDRASLEDQAEALEANENNSGKEKALYIYEDKVQFYEYGEARELPTGGIKRIEIVKEKKSVEIYFWGTFGLKLFSGLPISELEKFKSVMGAKTVIEESVKEKEKKQEKTKRDKSVYRDHEKFEITGDKIGGFIMGLVAVGAGVAVICLHFYVQQDVPWFLGAFFVAGGVIVMVSIFSSIPIVNKFIIPLLFGLFFTVAPTGIAIIVTDAKKEKLPIDSFAEFLKGFSPLTMVAVLLGAIGLMLIVISVVQLVKYIKHDD